MKKEEIASFARIITYAGQRTIITEKNKKTHVGFFDNNGDSKMTDLNKWNFKTFTKGEKVLNGDNFIKIQFL